MHVNDVKPDCRSYWIAHCDGGHSTMFGFGIELRQVNRCECGERINNLIRSDERMLTESEMDELIKHRRKVLDDN